MICKRPYPPRGQGLGTSFFKLNHEISPCHPRPCANPPTLTQALPTPAPGPIRLQPGSGQPSHTVPALRPPPPTASPRLWSLGPTSLSAGQDRPRQEPGRQGARTGPGQGICHFVEQIAQVSQFRLNILTQMARPIWAQGPLGPGPFVPRACLAPGRVWVQSPFGPRAHLAQGSFGPRARLGPVLVLDQGPFGPKAHWA